MILAVKTMIRVVAVTLVLGMATVAEAQIQGRLLVDGIEDGPMDPGAASRWTLGFRDAAGNALTDFELSHEKPMHLIVASADLETFAHVHPGYEPSTGVFTIDANVQTADPDNQHAARMVTRSGAHHVFLEVKPAGGEVTQQRFTVRATGGATPVPVVEDPIDGDGWIVKYVDATGAPAAEGAEYRSSVRIQAMKLDMVHVTVRLERRVDRGDAGATYEPVEDLENWLGMKAHAVMIGAAGETVGQRVFRHLHAGGHDDHARARDRDDILFMLHGDEVPPHGVYRTWIQVKRQGRVLTLPVTFEI